MDDKQSPTNASGFDPNAKNQDVPFDGNLISRDGSQHMPQGQQQMGGYNFQQIPMNQQPPATPYGNQPYTAQPIAGQQMPYGQQQPGTMQQPVQQQPSDTNGPDQTDAKDRAQSKPEGRRAVHAKQAQSAFMRRASKMRKLYVVIIVLLIIAVVAIAFFAVKVVLTADDSASQQTQTTSTEVTEAAEGDDTKDNDTPKTTVPNLIDLLGKSRRQAMELIGHGADVVSSRKVKDADSDVRRELRIELTDEPADSKSGAPTVYLSLNKAGKVIHAGYSVAIASLGYGSASFSDTVESEHIIENTLGEAGLSVEMGSAVLPEDATEYSSYSSDGSTVTKEYFSFAGKGTADSKTYDWEAILSYDYTVANASENLNDTLRTIFIYIS